MVNVAVDEGGKLAEVREVGGERFFFLVTGRHWVRVVKVKEMVR